MIQPSPYYQDDAVTIYQGRCEEIIPQLDLSEWCCERAAERCRQEVLTFDEAAV